MGSKDKSYKIFIGKYINPIYASIIILLLIVLNQFFCSYLCEIKIISTITSIILPAIISLIFIIIFYKYIWIKEVIILNQEYIETNRFNKIYYSDIQSTEIIYSKGSESLILTMKNSKKITLVASNNLSKRSKFDYTECKKEIIQKIVDRRG